MDFLQSLIITVNQAFESLLEFLDNVFNSLKAYLIDMPLNFFEKLMGYVDVLYEWTLESCQYCLDPLIGGDSLPAKMQDGFNNLPSGLLYMFHQSGLKEFFMILTCGFVVWANLKVIYFAAKVL